MQLLLIKYVILPKNLERKVVAHDMRVAKNAFRVIASLMFVLLASGIWAGSSVEGHHEKHDEHHDEHHHSPFKGQIDTKEEVVAYIQHHLIDAHDFVFWRDGETGKHYGFSLPVILWDGGLKMFSSAKFHHGETPAVIDGISYNIDHNNGRIYKMEGEDKVYPLDLSITKSVLGMLVTGLIMLLLFRSLAKSYSKGPIPTGIGRVLEPLVIYVRDEIAKPNIGEKKYRRFMGYLLTVFFFIWILNILGLTPLGFNVTGQIAVTACLALFTTIIYLASGNKHFWGHVLWMPGVPVVLRPILAIIELVGYLLIKPFSLLIRLFANITAGHFVLMSLIALMITLKQDFGPIGSTGISVALSLFIAVIEILVAFLQAFIFTMLTSLFIGMAVEDAHH